MEIKRPIRVAVVGSGMAGLVTAYLLNEDSRRRYQVKVFESGNSLSLDAASVSITSTSQNSSERVDLPMRAFAGGYYNNLKAMYDHLGIRYHKQEFLFEFAKAEPSSIDEKQVVDEDKSYFIHASNLHQTPPPRPDALTTVAYLVEIVYLLLCYTYFSLCCFLAPPRNSLGNVSETLELYLRRMWVPEYFATYYLLPLISSVTTCPHQALLNSPASDLIEYKRRTHGAPHYTVSNGVHMVQKKLVKGLEYQLNTVVTRVESLPHASRLRWRRVDAQQEHEEQFSKVILAVSPDIVEKIFEPLKQQMSKIPTMPVESVVHHDDIRHLTSEDSEAKNRFRDSAQLIYLRTSTEGMNRTESIHVQSSGALVTTCPYSPIEPSLTVKSAWFTRVLRTPESREIVNEIFDESRSSLRFNEEKKQMEWKNGDDNVWLVGGWCWDGMVLLEGCVVSAMRIAKAFGVDVPWLAQASC